MADVVAMKYLKLSRLVKKVFCINIIDEKFTYFQTETFRRINQICEQLKKLVAKQAKFDMLEGIIDSKRVATGDPSAFLSLKTIESEK